MYNIQLSYTGFLNVKDEHHENEFKTVVYISKLFPEFF